LKEFSNSRRLLPPNLVDRLQRFDGTRDVSRLDDADEGPSEALSGLEKCRGGGNLASSFGGTDGVSWVEVVDEEGLDGFVCVKRRG
jgi:hypothetical protein